MQGIFKLASMAQLWWSTLPNLGTTDRRRSNYYQSARFERLLHSLARSIFLSPFFVPNEILLLNTTTPQKLPFNPSAIRAISDMDDSKNAHVLEREYRIAEATVALSMKLCAFWMTNFLSLRRLQKSLKFTAVPLCVSTMIILIYKPAWLDVILTKDRSNVR